MLKMLKRLNKLKDKLDISKSNYKINKNIFRGILILILILVVSIVSIDGKQILLGKQYSCCPINANGGVCENTLYQANFCDVKDPDCNVQYFPAGTCLGDVPSILAQYFSSIVIFLILGGVGLNHLLYNRERRISK